MMDNAIQIRSCTPIALTVLGMGPFQEKPFHLDFVNERGESCNFFLLISPNGRGKTTLLEAMTSLMHIFGPNLTPAAAGLHDRLWSDPKARAQLDLRLTVSQHGKVREVLLTLAAGAGQPQETRSWEQSALVRVQTTEQLFIAWSRSPGGVWKQKKSKDPLVDELLALVELETRSVYETFGPDSITAPSLLYFDAYRDIPIISGTSQPIIRPPEWTYWPVHRFGLHGGQWSRSLDNLLVWLTWLDDGRYEQAQELLNRLVFSNTNKALDTISRQLLEARILAGGGVHHRLDQLSSGEKSLVLLLLRINLHLTTHSMILIDELEAHLHVKWQHRLYQALRRFIAENPSLTLIMTTHSLELVQQFEIDMKNEEPGLRLGGHLIEKNEI